MKYQVNKIINLINLISILFFILSLECNGNSCEKAQNYFDSIPEDIYKYYQEMPISDINIFVELTEVFNPNCINIEIVLSKLIKAGKFYKSWKFDNSNHAILKDKLSEYILKNKDKISIILNKKNNLEVESFFYFYFAGLFTEDYSFDIFKMYPELRLISDKRILKIIYKVFNTLKQIPSEADCIKIRNYFTSLPDNLFKHFSDIKNQNNELMFYSIKSNCINTEKIIKKIITASKYHSWEHTEANVKMLEYLNNYILHYENETIEILKSYEDTEIINFFKFIYADLCLVRTTTNEKPIPNFCKNKDKRIRKLMLKTVDSILKKDNEK